MLKPKTVRSATAFIVSGLISSSCLGFDLGEAYQLALSNDIQYQIEVSNLRAIEATLPQAESAFKPQISAQVSGNWVDSDNENSASFDNTSTATSLQYSQVIYDKERSASNDSAKNAIISAQLQLQNAKNDLVIRTAEAYFNILAAKDSLKFAQTEKQAIARQLEQAEKRYEVGLIAITDVKEAEARYDSAVAQELAAQNELDTNLQSLYLITGIIESDINTLSSDLSFNPPLPNDSEYWVNQALNNNLSVLSAQADLAIADANRKKAKYTNSTTLSVSASYGLTDSDNSLTGKDEEKDTVVGITLNVPLYTGGMNSALVAEQEARYQSAKNNVLLQKRIAAQQSRSLYLTILSQISQIKALTQASESSQTALEATNAGFEVGTRTSVDVLTSINETYRTQRDQSSAQYNYLLNVLRLHHSAGQLTQQHLNDVNAFLAP